MLAHQLGHAGEAGEVVAGQGVLLLHLLNEDISVTLERKSTLVMHRYTDKQEACEEGDTHVKDNLRLNSICS